MVSVNKSRFTHNICTHICTQTHISMTTMVSPKLTSVTAEPSLTSEVANFLVCSGWPGEDVHTHTQHHTHVHKHTYPRHTHKHTLFITLVHTIVPSPSVKRNTSFLQELLPLLSLCKIHHISNGCKPNVAQ